MKRTKLSIIMSSIILLILIACGNSNEEKFKEIDFSIIRSTDDYSEFLYFKNSIFGISSEIVDSNIYHNRIGNKIGEIKNIDNKVQEEGDVGVMDVDKDFLFKEGDGIYKVSDTPDKMLVLIKTDSGYLHTKLFLH